MTVRVQSVFYQAVLTLQLAFRFLLIISMVAMDAANDEAMVPLAKQPFWRRWAPRALRVGIALIVAAGIGRRLWLEQERLASLEHDVDLFWMAAAGVAYVSGLAGCALFWWLSIRDQGLRPGVITTAAAYFAGHLGKYVPGKGLVVVIRAGMLRDSAVGWSTGSVSCVHETLLMMATGALVTVALLPALDSSIRRWMALPSMVLAAALLIPSLPPVVSRWARWVTKPFQRDDAAPTYTVRWATVLWGIVIIAVGWIFMGLSLAAILAAMGGWSPLWEQSGTLETAALLTAAVALATVGGFVSLLPGGLGSREWILVEILGPVLPMGAAQAMIAAVLLRLVWLLSEAAATGLLWLLDQQCKKRQIASF